jgi:hypothetical protein
MYLLVIGTHGRSFWILDDITALRQLNNKLTNQSAILYKPQTAIRVRWSMYPDTPVPQEEPAGQNPPDGAIINYYLRSNAKNVTLEIIDSKGTVIRKYASTDTLYAIPPNNVPSYWIRPQQLLSAQAGAHRFMWDMHYQPLNVPPAYPISATYMNTAPDPTSPWVLPGMYTVRLTVDGEEFKQTFAIKMDPRVKTSVKDMAVQHDLSITCYNYIKKCMSDLKTVSDKDQLTAVRKYLNSFTSLQNILQDGDWPPTTQIIKAVKETVAGYETIIKKGIN